MATKKGRNVSIGNQDFAYIRKRDLFYVDKTDFIRQWWEAGDPITLIVRPRRFGKTLNMQMLESFFSVENKGYADLFEGSEIWQHEKYRKLQGTIPVISLTFSSMKNDTFEGFLARIKDAISVEYKSKKYLLESDVLDKGEKKYFMSINDAMINNFMTQEIIETSISKLCTWLKRYHGISPIVLLDEYDAPMQEAWVHGYWDEMCSFMRSFMNENFKTNLAIGRGLLTGVTRVSKESIFSGLNNINVVTTMSGEYETCCGFTEDEVFAALDEMGMSDKHKEAKEWYDGFTFGDAENIYNPWSVTCYLSKQKPACYWANTSDNALVGDLVRQGSATLKADFEELLRGGTIEAVINEQIVFNRLDRNPNAVWSLLLATGYLRVVKPAEIDPLNDFGGEKTKLALTNREVRRMFSEIVAEWLYDAQIDEDYNKFIRCLLVADTEGMQDYLNEVAQQSFSFFDVGSKGGAITDTVATSASERFYHGFILGLLVELNGRYELTSNRESGNGRYDVMLKPLRDTDPAYILEFKAINAHREKTLEETLAAAKAQIKERNYAASLEAAGIEKNRIHELGIAFQGKRCIIG